MKNILVAVDSSKGSTNALEYAIGLANIIHSDIIMLWIDKQLEPEHSLILADGNEYKDAASKQIAELMQTYTPLLINGKLHYKIRKGKTYTEMAIQAKLSNSSLIITNTLASGGYDEYLSGNDAFKVVVAAPCPVITVHPNSTEHTNYAHILLPLDSTATTLQKVPVIIELALVLGAEIHILGMNTTGLMTLQKKVDDNVRKVEQQLELQGISFSSEMVRSTNVTQTILSYAEKIGAGLIAIMTEQEPSESSLLMGLQSQHIIRMSDIPVLSVQPHK